MHKTRRSMWSESSVQQTLPWPPLVGSYDRPMDTQPRMHFFPLWARCANAQRSSHTAQGGRESRHDPESGGGMLPVGFKAAGDLSLVCGHQVSHPKLAPGFGSGRLPPLFGQSSTLPSSA